jgi:hypothetical protein
MKTPIVAEISAVSAHGRHAAPSAGPSSLLQNALSRAENPNRATRSGATPRPAPRARHITRDEW